MRAACAVKARGKDVHPEIMIPLVTCYNEFRNQEQIIREAADAARQEYLSIAEYMEGPMKQAMIDIADGKTVNMAYGDALWDELGQGSSVIIVTFDTESGIFEAEYKG